MQQLRCFRYLFKGETINDISLCPVHIEKSEVKGLLLLMRFFLAVPSAAPKMISYHLQRGMRKCIPFRKPSRPKWITHLLFVAFQLRCVCLQWAIIKLRTGKCQILINIVGCITKPCSTRTEWVQVERFSGWSQLADYPYLYGVSPYLRAVCSKVDLSVPSTKPNVVLLEVPTTSCLQL